MMIRMSGFLIRLVSFALIGAGFVQHAYAGPIDTAYMVDQDARAASLARLEVLLARDDVAAQLEDLGVAPSAVMDRLRGLSDSELLSLQGKLDEQVAGGDALAVIGMVFLVLMILELVGITDIFKSF